MNRKITWLAAPLVALALTSCVDESDGEAAAPEANKDSTYVDITDQQGALEDFVGALEDATVEKCEAGGDGWLSEGTVTNPTDDTLSYRIYVAFNENRDTRGLTQVDLANVAAGETVPWSVEAPIGGDNLTCVLRVERGTI